MNNIVLEIISILISSTIVSFTCWYYTPDSVIPAKIFLPILITILIILYGVIKYCFYLQEKISTLNAFSIPKLKTVENDVFIFSPSELFATNSVASIWFIDDIEKNIGYGYVETVNSKKYLQVKINYYCKGYNSNFIKKNKNKIILKPTILADAVTLNLSQKEGNHA
ncbi:MAG: hypothetical protein E7Z88_00325 [Cyanobacteria bacterium SIG27]|nr:hypothetical protein [Cyanobacteria bacterium SIG27]